MRRQRARQITSGPAKQKSSKLCTRKSVAITDRQCRTCYLKYAGMIEVSVSQFKMIRDSHHDGKSEIKVLKLDV